MKRLPVPQTVRRARTPWRVLALDELLQLLLDSLPYTACVLAAGFAVALFAWELAHPELLAAFVFDNRLPAGERSRLLAALLMGMAAALLLWALAGLAVALRDPRRPAAVLPHMRRLAPPLLAFALLPFWPVLALPGIESEHTALVFCLVAAMALIAYAAARGVLALVPEAPGRTVARLHRLVAEGRPALLLVVALAAAYAVFMAVLTTGRHNIFATHSFDLGIHDQAMWNLLHSGYMRSTQYGVEAINYIGDHFSPIFYLLLPVYAVYQDARTLLVLQSVLLAAGAVPVFLLAHRVTRDTALALSLAAAYLLFPALHGANTFDFHQLALVTPLLLTCLYAIELGNWRLFWVFLCLSLAVKEDIALSGAAIGLYLFAARRQYRRGALVAVLCAVYFVVVVKGVMPALGGVPQINRFAGLMAPESGGFAGILATLATNPFYVFTFVFFNLEKMTYVLHLLLPLAALPLLGGAAWLVAVPALAMSLLSSAETQYSIAYHYSALVVPFLFYLAVAAVRRLDPSRWPRLALAAAVLVASLGMNYEYGWLLGKRFTGFPAPDAHDRAVAELIAEIPASASVSAMSDLLPHLSARRDIFLFPVVAGADYILFDSDPWANFWPYISRDARGEALHSLAGNLTDGAYGVVRTAGGALLLRRGHDTSGNAAALVEAFSSRYEAEALRSNYPVEDLPDPAAGRDAARVARLSALAETPAGHDSVTFGPYAALLPGRYRANFILKLDGAAGDAPVARLEVFSNSAGGALASLEVNVRDFAAPGQYQAFTLDLDTPQRWEDVEYRVLYRGGGDLWVDAVHIVPTGMFAPVSTYEAEYAAPAAEPGTGEGADSGLERTAGKDAIEGAVSAGVERVADNAASGEAALAVPAAGALPADAPPLLAGSLGGLLPGQYRLSAVLKLPAEAAGPVAGVELVVKATGQRWAWLDVSAEDFAGAGRYQTFFADFATEVPLPEIEYRFYRRGEVSMWVDKVMLARWVE